MALRDRIKKIVGKRAYVAYGDSGLVIRKVNAPEYPTIQEVEEDCFVMSNGKAYSIRAVAEIDNFD
jgi:hypothetical protein